MAIQKPRFISIFINEVTTMDCQSWLGVHVYRVDGWKCNPILLSLEQLVNVGIVDNLTKVIVDNVFQYQGLSKFDLVSKLISFGLDEISISKVQKLVLQHNCGKNLPPNAKGTLGCTSNKLGNINIVKTTSSI
jgi:hypothetical protein